MPVPKPAHIEEQDPKFFALRKETYVQWTIWGVLTVIAGLLLGSFGIALSLIVLGYLVLSTILRIYHKLQVEQLHHYWQTEALFSLYSTLKITQPLPPMRLWAASPDFVNMAVSLIREHHPAFVLEIGSGVSTLVSAYALQDTGGRLISLEHDENFAQVTAANVTSHGLDSIASVRYAPLKSIEVSGVTQPWYDTAALGNLPGPVDLLVVDGPPSGTAAMARYPALPMVFEYLKPGAYILVDDFMRDDEHVMVNRWLEEYDLTLVRTYANEKGAAILQKTR